MEQIRLCSHLGLAFIFHGKYKPYIILAEEVVGANMSRS